MLQSTDSRKEILLSSSAMVENKKKKKKRSSDPPPSSPALVVGHCCHDSIKTASGSCFEALGGSASYISNIFDALGIPLRLVSKVGPDFAYSDLLSPHTPTIASSSSTTHFFADFTLGQERVLRTGPVCEPIFPSDIPSLCHSHGHGMIGDGDGDGKVPQAQPICNSIAPFDVRLQAGKDDDYCEDEDLICHSDGTMREGKRGEDDDDSFMGKEIRVHPSDIPLHDARLGLGLRFHVGLAVGIVGEISAETLQKMADVCTHLVVDIQALIRTIDPHTGLVGLKSLEDTPFYHLLHRVSFLKAAQNESLFINLEDARKKTSVIVTQGKLGCTVYCKESKFSLPAFEAVEEDPTGAGDSFLAGFSAGLYQGFSVRDAALMGNYFGALAVGQVGLPRFSKQDIQKVRMIVNGQRVLSENDTNGFSE